jgi:L-ascorbate metabolism protein UlaG (beta-lactamase superfamily)
MGAARITSLGNAGFLVATETCGILFDPFAWELPVLSPAALPARIDAILITHSHWDHFTRARVAALASATGAFVCGPSTVMRALAADFPADRLLDAEPDRSAGEYRGVGRRAPQRTLAAGRIRITAFRSVHSRDHTSYFVDLGGLRVFHDGDNEDTTVYDPAVFRDLDVLMLCPWSGSRWVDFIESVKPARWFLMHLDEGEIRRHRNGLFLPELCDRIPMESTALLPGESIEV